MLNYDLGSYPIKKVVNKNVIKYQTNCPFKIAECEGIKVVELNPDDPADSYFYIRDNKIYIAINKKFEKDCYIFLLAHELGHIIYHKDKFSHYFNSKCSTTKGKKDHEADFFANYLLNDDNALFFDSSRKNCQIGI
ncbi:MAG: ImmA/IrrE family metallo-endopeptidase [Bacillota bacterium]